MAILYPLATRIPINFSEGLFLSLVAVEDCRAVLLADIGALAVDLGRIVNLKEQFGQFFIADPGGVENYFDRFGVTGGPAADLLVARIVAFPAHVAGADRNNALGLL